MPEATFARTTSVGSDPSLGASQAGSASFWLTELSGKSTKLGEGEGSKLGGPCPKVRLSQDRLPIEPFARMES